MEFMTKNAGLFQHKSNHWV